MHMYEKDKEGYMLYPGFTRFPNILGHEFSGRVVAVGSEVSELKIGDLVTAEEIQWCGECVSCRRGFVNHCDNLDDDQAVKELHGDLEAEGQRPCRSRQRHLRQRRRGDGPQGSPGPQEDVVHPIA